MSYGIQSCVRCGTMEHGHTGYGDRYICSACAREGWRVDAGGNLYATPSEEKKES